MVTVNSQSKFKVIFLNLATDKTYLKVSLFDEVYSVQFSYLKFNIEHSIALY